MLQSVMVVLVVFQVCGFKPKAKGEKACEEDFSAITLSNMLLCSRMRMNYVLTLPN